MLIIDKLRIQRLDRHAYMCVAKDMRVHMDNHTVLRPNANSSFHKPLFCLGKGQLAAKTPVLISTFYCRNDDKN